MYGQPCALPMHMTNLSRVGVSSASRHVSYKARRLSRKLARYNSFYSLDSDLDLYQLKYARALLCKRYARRMRVHKKHYLLRRAIRDTPGAARQVRSAVRRLRQYRHFIKYSNDAHTTRHAHGGRHALRRRSFYIQNAATLYATTVFANGTAPCVRSLG